VTSRYSRPRKTSIARILPTAKKMFPRESVQAETEIDLLAKGVLLHLEMNKQIFGLAKQGL
jgi:hypothetical protein